MVKLTLFLILINSTIVFSQSYSPLNLYKLDDEQRINYVYKKIFPDSLTIYKDTLGNIIPKPNFSDPNLFSDFYINSEGKIEEVIVRIRTEKDKELFKKIITAAQIRDNGRLVEINIDCNDKKKLLEKMYDSDQKDRSNRNAQASIDMQNISVLVSIIKNCGFPSIKTVGTKGMHATFLILQHSPNYIMEEYFVQILEAAKNGDLSMKEVALMEDRILMNNGKLQKYGSQIIYDKISNTYKLYPLMDPKHVNQRRLEVGLEPIEKYLLNWNIEFTPN